MRKAIFSLVIVTTLFGSLASAGSFGAWVSGAPPVNTTDGSFGAWVS